MARFARRLRPLWGFLLGGVAVLLLLTLVDPWDLVRNPFSSRSVDRTGPAVLRALEDLAEYHAATGSLQVVLDVERDVRFLPRALIGERTTFLATGDVDAVVDLRDLDDDAVEVSDDRRSVRIALPRATVGDVRVDPDRSYVLDRDRGVLDRLGGVFSDDPTSDRALYQAAEVKLRDAANEAALTQRAEQNTRRMLRALLRSLGFTDVTVVFEAAPNPG